MSATNNTSVGAWLKKRRPRFSSLNYFGSCGFDANQSGERILKQVAALCELWSPPGNRHIDGSLLPAVGNNVPKSVEVPVTAVRR
jgi:hypothetical protein